MIASPEARLFHSGDLKADDTLLLGPVTDFKRLNELRDEGVDAVVLDSTRVHLPGFAQPDAQMRQTFHDIVAENKGKRLIFVVYSGYAEMIAGVCEAAAHDGRDVVLKGGPALTGAVAALNRAGIDIGAMTLNATGKRVKIHEARAPEADALGLDQQIIITTGSQADDGAALTEAAFGRHPRLKLGPDDVVVMCVPPLIGYEQRVAQMLAAIRAHGTKVITADDRAIRQHAHGFREDMVKILQALGPRLCLPTHGSLAMREQCKKLAESIGIPATMASNGDSWEITERGAICRARQSQRFFGVSITGQPGTAHRDYEYRRYDPDPNIPELTFCRQKTLEPDARPRHRPRPRAPKLHI